MKKVLTSGPGCEILTIFLDFLVQVVDVDRVVWPDIHVSESKIILQ